VGFCHDALPGEDMFQNKYAFEREDLLMCARGEMFGPNNAQLPEPPMLMIDRITELSADGGDHGKGHINAEGAVTPESWFFKGHFPGNPVMPGCLALDTAFQLTGFNLGWRGLPGQGYGLGAGETKFFGKVTPDTKLLQYQVHFTRVIKRKLSLGIADARVWADGQEIYTFRGLRVGLSVPE
jgi:3-hydroxyacyl-[acyl-carrier protein] dehydratase/trans-2-decenoyl-[acyl-carrier protein] isomerase